MSKLTDALLRVDPTAGFVDYVQTIKPYHTKILDVFIEYVWTEEVNVQVRECYDWNIQLFRPREITVRDCGYGVIWDPVSIETDVVNITDANSTTSVFTVPSETPTTYDFSVSNVYSNQLTFTGTPPGTWLKGTPVQVSTTGTLPDGLSGSDTYYFIPQPVVGVFNLAKKPIPKLPSDYVNIIDGGSGTHSIVRLQRYVRGAQIQVKNSAHNDGRYVVYNSYTSGGSEIVSVFPRIPRNKTGAGMYDGFIVLAVSGFDEPYYCPPTETPSNMLADTYIHERLVFEIGLSFGETIATTVVENKPYGFGEDPYSGLFSGGFTPALTAPTTGKVVLPTGVDANLFDVGGLDENVSTAAILSGGTYPA